METPSFLSDLVQVNSRFGRSVNLERDFYLESVLTSYIVTPTVRSTLARISEALGSGARSRAWTLTGPYGSGKSAFAFFITKLFYNIHHPESKRAQSLLKSEDQLLWRKLFDGRSKTLLRDRGLCPVLITGSRQPLNLVLLRGLKRAVDNFWPSTKSLSLKAKIEKLYKQAERGKTLPVNIITELVEELAEKVCSSRHPGSGLLIIIDELGKLLEYAAHHPREGDVFALQNLAELAARSGERPILLITTLHQAFEQYAEQLSATQRQEWAKIQGRFEDIAFREPQEQILRLLARAIEWRRSVDSINPSGRVLAERAWHLNLAPRGMHKGEFTQLVQSCLPLHPIVALVLGPLFRRLAQNERSLFSFLTSQEPFGFQQFLSTHRLSRDSLPILGLAELYDYIVAAIGSGLYARGDGKRWAEVESALERSTVTPDIDARLIKTIGMLAITGEINNLRASDDVLNFAIDGISNGDGKEIKRALSHLKKRSIIVYRKTKNAYSLWEGSDVDIDKRLREARLYVNPNERSSKRLVDYFAPRPVVVRRHSLETGTLRYFDTRYADLESFGQVTAATLGDADGVIVYTLPSTEAETDQLQAKACGDSLRVRPEVLVAVPKRVAQLHEALQEVACLHWIKSNTPELEGDVTARRELRARLAQAEQTVEMELRALFDPARPAQEEGCFWYHRGKPVEIKSQRELIELLSRICDEVYSCTPRLRNELVNRRQLSSSAAAARRKLTEAMLTRANQPHLGLEGFPPEKSIYYSLLQETSLHREENGGWGFFPPKPPADQGIQAVWEAVNQFFTESELGRRTAKELFELLKKPPYGLKDGVLPVLLCAALVHYDTEIALYEQGSFVPELSAEVFDRLVKSPEKFQLQRCRIAGVRAAVFERFAQALSQTGRKVTKEKATLLDVVRPLVRFAAHLPNYARATQRLSETAKRVREALFQAREPDRFLFSQLPEACGFLPFSPDDQGGEERVEPFFKTLREALAELQRAYDDLLGDIERLIAEAFSLRSTGEEARFELRDRAQPLLDITVDPKLKSFLVRATDELLDHRAWIESIGTLLASKPPVSWNDLDRARFEINLAEVARSFHHMEVLSFELAKHVDRYARSGVEALRLGITVPSAPEHERVVLISPNDHLIVEQAENDVEEALKAAEVTDVELKLAVLARLSKKLLQQLDERGKAKTNSPV